jgi:hypothetical protein
MLRWTRCVAGICRIDSLKRLSRDKVKTTLDTLTRTNSSGSAPHHSAFVVVSWLLIDVDQGTSISI